MDNRGHATCTHASTSPLSKDSCMKHKHRDKALRYIELQHSAKEVDSVTLI
jgi:hypothetical protein